MRIYLIRHGETDLNVRGCYYGRSNAELTQNGREQASQLASFFQGMSWDGVYVSPLKRTVDTASLVTGLGRDDFILEEALMEQNFGIFEGKTYRELCDRYPKEFEAWNQDFANYEIPEGESFQAVRDRVQAWFSALPSAKGQILVVAHKGTLGHMMAALLGLPLDGYWNFVFEQGCYSCIDYEDGYAILRKINQSV